MKTTEAVFWEYDTRGAVYKPYKTVQYSVLLATNPSHWVRQGNHLANCL